MFVVGVEKTPVRWLFLRLGYQACAVLMILFIRDVYGITEPHFKNHPGSLFAGSTALLAVPQNTLLLNLVFLVVSFRSRFTLVANSCALFEGFGSLHADSLPNLHRAGIAIVQEQDRIFARSRKWRQSSVPSAIRQRDRQRSRYVDTTCHAQAAQSMRPGMTTKAHSRNGAKLQFWLSTLGPCGRKCLDMELRYQDALGLKIQGRS